VQELPGAITTVEQLIELGKKFFAAANGTEPTAAELAQLRAAIDGLAPSEIVVAYEPVWAIGTGKAATEEQAQQVCSALRLAVTEAWGVDSGDATRILYGGSVKASNISAFMRQPDVDGALVGGASLDVAEFSSICRFLKHVV
jgi:triosephosphate isomerase